MIFDGPTRFAQWLTGFYAFLRSKGLYYGDSAIFLRRNVYEEIGGIKPIALMEDYDLVSRLEGLPVDIALSFTGLEKAAVGL